MHKVTRDDPMQFKSKKLPANPEEEDRELKPYSA